MQMFAPGRKERRDGWTLNQKTINERVAILNKGVQHKKKRACKCDTSPRRGDRDLHKLRHTFATNVLQSIDIGRRLPKSPTAPQISLRQHSALVTERGAPDRRSCAPEPGSAARPSG